MFSVVSHPAKACLAVFTFFLVVVFLPVAAVSPAQANSKYAAIVIDANTGKTLYASRADAHRFPASLTKMMTLYLLFEALDTGRISKDTRIRFSSHAAGQPPSKLGIGAGNSITVENAIYALVTKSANDVAAAVGEHLAGSESAFGRMMTAKARQLGMKSTVFRNASGLPDEQQVTTAHDMAILGLALREHFPHQYSYFSTRSFKYGGRRYSNHNRLLGQVRGVDGIKTGYTRASGYNLVTSVHDGKRRIVAVVMGGRSGKSRNAHMTDLIRRYLPKASRRARGPLVAARKTLPYIVLAELPAAEAPVPEPRPVKLATASAAAAAPTKTRVRPPEAVGAGKAPVKAENPGASVVAANAEAIGDADPDEVAVAVANALPSGWVVQVASLPSESEAREYMSRTRQAAGPVLAGATGFTEEFEKNGTVYHRVRFAGFDSKETAWKACSTLKKRNISCYAVAR